MTLSNAFFIHNTDQKYTFQYKTRKPFSLLISFCYSSNRQDLSSEHHEEVAEYSSPYAPRRRNNFLLIQFNPCMKCFMHAPNEKKSITQIISILPSVKLENLMHCYKHFCIIHKCISPPSVNPSYMHHLYLFFTTDFLIHHIVCTTQFLIHHVCTNHNCFHHQVFNTLCMHHPQLFSPISL